jgi:hypothetical protein
MARPTRTPDRAAPGRVTASIDALKNIAELINSGGQISVGQLPPVRCAAVANDDDNCLAMLQRRPGESLHDLLLRLDAAIAIAWNEARFIDEINPPSTPSRRP